MDEPGGGEFLDLVYRTPFEPDLWVPVMERFADAIGAKGGLLSEFNMLDGSGAVEVARADPAQWRGRYFAYYAQRNPLSNVIDPDTYLRGWRPKILTDEDWMAKEDLVASEFYNDFLAPQDIHSVMMVRLATRGADVAALSFSRTRRRGRYANADLERAQALHPHLISAFRLGRQFADPRGLGQDMAWVLDRSPHGVLLLDEVGRVRYANRAAESLIALNDPLSVSGGRLRAARPADTQRLLALIGAALTGDGAARCGGAMPLTSATRRLSLSLTVAPIRSERFSLFHDGPAAMVCVTDLEAAISVSEAKLRDLFGFTPAEIRVARALFAGGSPREAAASLDLSFFTVRGHLVRMFEKTQTRGQVELVRLLMRIAGPARPSRDRPGEGPPP